MKNFVFISPHFPDCFWKFCLALKNRGFCVLGIGDCPYDRLQGELKYALTEYYCCYDMENYDNEKRAVEYFEKKYGHIDFLESNNEFWLEKDAMLRKDFNITTGPFPDEVKFYKHKSLQKEIFKRAGLKCARYTLDTTLDNLLNFVKEVNYPIFAKPDNGVGAHGTYKINNEAELVNFVNSKDKNVPYIVEEYVYGQIISYDGISNSKGDVIFSTSNEFVTSVADIVNQNLDDMYYCIPEIDPNFDEIGRKVVKEFNLRNRFFHIEFFRLLEDHPYLGKVGTIIPLEGNMRPAGGYTPDLINFANSISCYDIYADSIAYDENRQCSIGGKFFAITPSRRYSINYEHTNEEIIKKYWYAICLHGVYPQILRDAMGDYYFMAKFKTKKEADEFDNFVRLQKK